MLKFSEIEKYMEYLFSVALKKCGSLEDAEDITQEVLLTALNYKKEIENEKAWLSSVLNHKYYDMLRRKYKLPTISIDLIPEEEEPTEETDKDMGVEADFVRREVAYLAEKYREVIVRYYLNGEKVQYIADQLGIPKGTVLSRLAYGREQMKKGFDEMDSYEKQSFMPDRLDISCNGSSGLNGEPWSLVEGDLMKQNILIIAYEKPLNVVEISKGLGIPAAYVEKAVEDLITGQLMVKQGNRVYTDFLIKTPEQILGALEAQIEFAKKYYTVIWGCIKEATEILRLLDWFQKMPISWQNKLEYYFILHTFSAGIYTAMKKLIPAKETFPLRPDGGQWVAQGYRYPMDFDYDNYMVGHYSYAGERCAEYQNFMSENSVCLHVYDTQPDLNKYEKGPVKIQDEELCVLVYLIHKGIPLDAVAFDPLYLHAIPHLADCGIFRYESNKPVVDIPVIQKIQYREMEQIRFKYFNILAEKIADPLRKVLPKLKLSIPSHLESRIIEFRKYDCYAIPMAIIKQAIEKGDFVDSNNKPPMTLVIDSPYIYN